MSTTCADERYTIPGRGFRNPYANSPRAPRQVIGFDLPATAGKAGLALDSDDDSANFNCLYQYSLSSQKTSIPKGNSPAATSPRSALQQLLLPTAAGSEPAYPLAAGNSLSISQALSIVEPASSKAPTAKQPAAAVELTSTAKACTVVGRVPVPAPAFNWPASKGIAQLVYRPSLHSASIRDRHGVCPPVVTVGELKSVSRTGMRSCQSPEVTALHAWSGSSKRQVSTKTTLDAKDTLPEEGKKSYWTEKAAMKMERPRGTVGIDRKQVSIHISDKNKKSSLFLLSSNSPVAEYGNELGADQCKFLSMDMEFLNSCHLCKRGLGQGHDVFMYRGDKAFCSMECRCQQILMDDRKERRTPPVIRSGSSPAYRSNMASTSRNAGMNEAGVSTPPTHHSISIDRHDFMSSAAAA